MYKDCEQCKVQFSKPPTCSRRDWGLRRFCSMRCKGANSLGKPSWNKGLKLSDHPQYAHMGYQKGHPMLTSYRRSFSPEDRAKAHAALRTNGGPWNKGKKVPQITGPKHVHWKGGYQHKLMANRRRRALQLGAQGDHIDADWDALKQKYNHMCLCCKKQEPFITLTEDHIVPLTAGGSNSIDNIQPLCQSCNTRKYTKVIEYTTYVTQIHF